MHKDWKLVKLSCKIIQNHFFGRLLTLSQLTALSYFSCTNVFLWKKPNQVSSFPSQLIVDVP